MYKLVHEQRSDNFNVAPAGWRPITEKEFAQSNFFVYSPEMIDYKQMYRLESGEPLPKPVFCRLFHMHDKTGFAMEHNYSGGKVNYYAFGCKHDYRELGQDEAQGRGMNHYGMFCHIYECRTCGNIEKQDSSG